MEENKFVDITSLVDQRNIKKTSVSTTPQTQEVLDIAASIKDAMGTLLDVVSQHLSTLDGGIVIIKDESKPEIDELAMKDELIIRNFLVQLVGMISQFMLSRVLLDFPVAIKNTEPEEELLDLDYYEMTINKNGLEVFQDKKNRKQLIYFYSFSECLLKKNGKVERKEEYANFYIKMSQIVSDMHCGLVRIVEE